MVCGGQAQDMLEGSGALTRRTGLNAMLVEAAGSVGRMHGKYCCDFDAP